MKIIIVPGNSFKNKEWAQKLEKFLRLKKKHNVLSVEYFHWNSEESIINIEEEAVRLGSLIPLSEEYLVVAKSAGILVSLKAFLSGRINPKSFIFLGLPLRWAIEKEINIDIMFNEFSASALLIQNDKDPIASTNEVHKFLQKLKPPKEIQLIETSGDTHEYDDFKFISSFIDKIK